MKVIEVSRLNSEKTNPPMAEVSVRLDEIGPGHAIETVNWEAFPYKPEVRFNIAWGERGIYLKYYVKESTVKAEKTLTNEMVCEDSCVEFFVAPSDDGIYYNLEFNPIGTILMGTGHGRHDSVRADAQILKGVRRITTLGTEPFAEICGDVRWSLTIAIPPETFFHHKISDLRGKSFRANFYKCGDMLSNPHYVTWNPVGTEKPDFHRPEYFGTLRFV
ncbi:MAG: carbohydrate-binding family 9-like protein [Bacteroidales bacterium]